MNLPEKLASELVRVTIIRCRYESLRYTKGVNVEPAIAMMSHAIDRCIKAIGEGDAVEQMDALNELKGF